MNHLWLDLGNTRLKYWITQQDSRILEHAAELHLQSPVDLLLGLSQHFKTQNISSIGISSVLDQNTNERIKQILHRLKAPIVFAKVHAKYANLITGYDAPSQLGIDRWLQVLAMSQHKQKFCIIGCGTAMTIDLLDMHEHLGGYILPSLYLQRDALTQGTKGIKIPEQAFSDLKAGRNTADAVHHGILLGLIGAIRHTLTQYPDFKLVLTGGDARLFGEFLQDFNPEIKQDLLLNGLQYYVHTAQTK